MTLEITRAETEARIHRYLQSGQFHDFDELLAKALDALPEPMKAVETPPERRTGQVLVDACAEVRSLLTDDEIDRMSSRNASPRRRPGAAWPGASGACWDWATRPRSAGQLK